MLEVAFGWGPDSPLARYFQSVEAGHLWLIAAAACVLFVVLVERFAHLWGRSRRIALYGVSTLIAAWGVSRAYELSWLSDDAFISFRYARNWVAGHGLVYNPGERVEGYTNFLWTALIAFVIRLGLQAERWSMVLSLASMAGVIGLVTKLLGRMHSIGRPPVIPLTCLLLAANYIFASFGTSGLETMAATFLVLLAVERADAGAFVQAGVAAIAATMMHPDHALFYAALAATVALGTQDRWRNVARYGAPFIVLFLPYYLLRWRYYGDFFPNTYYAKSGGAAYFTQGAVYLWVSGLAAGVVAAVPFSIWGAVLYRRHLVARFTLLAVPSYLVYVAKIGGDFMLGRLLCPVLPFLFLMAELAMRRLLHRFRHLPLAMAGTMALALGALPNGVVKAHEKYLNIADERTVYPLRSFDPIVVDTHFTEQARALLRAFERAPRKPLVAVGCIGVVGWLTDYPIMDNWGLVNRSVAHMAIRHRGRPGHEKLATPGHAFDHDVDFSDVNIWPEPYASWSALDLSGFGFSLAKFDPPLIHALEQAPSVKVPNIEGKLLNFSTRASDGPRLDCDHWFIEQFYFSSHQNEQLRKTLIDKWIAARPELAGLGDLLFGPPAERDPKWRSQTLFSFDDLKDWTRTGDAFADDPTLGDVPGQGRAAGARGRYVNSLHGRTFDVAGGRLTSPPFVIRGDAITLRVGGGMKPSSAVARLRVEDNVVASSTGCDSDVLGRRVWPVSAFRGKNATFEVVDEAYEGWSHILVDEVVEWSRDETSAQKP